MEGKTSVRPACVPPQRCCGHGLSLGRPSAIFTANCSADKYLHPCGYVYILLSHLLGVPPTMEAGSHHGADHPIYLQLFSIYTFLDTAFQRTWLLGLLCHAVQHRLQCCLASPVYSISPAELYTKEKTKANIITFNFESALQHLHTFCSWPSSYVLARIALVEKAMCVFVCIF